MPYEVFLALRYLYSRPRHRLTRATSLAAVLGIMLGVAALIIALALANGFRDEMRSKILEGNAHISLFRSDGLSLQTDNSLFDQVRRAEGVTTVATTTYDGALVVGPKGSSYAVLRGLDETQEQVLPPKSWLVDGSFGPMLQSVEQPPGAVLGSELAKRVGLSKDDVFEIIPASNATDQRNKFRRLRVVGIFRSGLFEYDSTWIYVSVNTAEVLAGANHATAVMSVQVKDADKVKATADKLRNSLGDKYSVIDWQQANQPLFAALALERRMGIFIIGLIVAVAAFNITTMLILVVVERRRDIAILNALGATRNSVMLLFIIKGAVVGAAGAILGVIIGLSACLIGNHYKLVSLPADVYSISNVPLNARLTEALLAALIAFVLSVLATIYPARTAAGMKPVDTLRNAA